MKHVFVSFAALALTACATPPVLDVAQAPAGQYVLDPSHTSVTWSLSHAGLSFYTARFDDVTGTLDFNPDMPTASKMDIRIDPMSVSTGDPDWDETLATSGNYFDADTYPDITFAVTSSTQDTATTGTVTGNLTLRGVTKPVTLDVTYNGAGKSFGKPGKTLGFSATGTFNRSDWGLDYLITLANIGDEITLRIETEFNEAQ